MNTKIHKMHRTNAGSYKSFIALIAMFALLASQLFYIGAKTVQAQDNRNADEKQKLAAQRQLADTAKSQIRNRASQYNRAVSQVRTLSSRSINTKKEVESVVSTLRQNRSALDTGPYPMMFNMALNDASFKKAVEDEAKKVGYEKLIAQLKINPNMITRFTNARQLQTKMKSDLSQQADHFKILGNKLKAAKEQFEREAKSPRRSSLVPGIANNPYIMTFASYSSSVFDSGESERKTCSATIIPVDYNSSTKRASLAAIPAALETALVAAAIVIITAAAAAAAVLIKGYVDAKVEDFTDPPDEAGVPGGGVSDYKKCTDEADAKLDSCLDGIPNVSNNLPFWEKTAADLAKAAKEAGCWSVYTLRMADCLLLPQ